MRFTPARLVYTAARCLASAALALGFWAGVPQQAQAQDEDEETSTGYEREFNYGVNFNTNGGKIGGITFKYAWQRKPGWYNRIYFEAVHLKHPKEYRLQGPISSYIANKVNYLFALRPSFGQEFVLFSKAPEEGVQLNLIFGAGPTLGIVKPYYVLVTDDPPNDSYVYSRKYDPAISPNKIAGVGRVTDGFDQLSLVPGVHFRAGLAFESGRIRSSVFGIEGGFVTEIYSRSVELLRPQGGSTSNPQAYNGLYLVLYYGSKH